jgi:hypothetical protein
VKYYLASYSDLQSAFGTDYARAFDHWVGHGRADGRKGAP